MNAYHMTTRIIPRLLALTTTIILGTACLKFGSILLVDSGTGTRPMVAAIAGSLGDITVFSRDATTYTVYNSLAQQTGPSNVPFPSAHAPGMVPVQSLASTVGRRLLVLGNNRRAYAIPFTASGQPMDFEFLDNQAAIHHEGYTYLSVDIAGSNQTNRYYAVATNETAPFTHRLIVTSRTKLFGGAIQTTSVTLSNEPMFPSTTGHSVPLISNGYGASIAFDSARNEVVVFETRFNSSNDVSFNRIRRFNASLEPLGFTDVQTNVTRFARDIEAHNNVYVTLTSVTTSANASGQMILYHNDALNAYENITVTNVGQSRGGILGFAQPDSSAACSSQGLPAGFLWRARGTSVVAAPIPQLERRVVCNY